MNNYEDKIQQEITDFANSHIAQYQIIINEIRSYLSRSSEFATDFYSLQSFLNQFIQFYFDEALNSYHSSKSKTLKEEIIAIADYKLDRRYDVMIALDDEEAFDKVLGYATDFLKGDSFLFDQGLYVNGESLYALVKAYYNPKFKNTVLSFFNTAFEYAKVYAQEKIEYGKKANKDPDAETLLELVQALSSFREGDKEQFADLIFEIYNYSSKEERSYEMNQASGFIAIRLTYLQTEFDIQVINDAITKTGEHYQETAFVKQTLYTKWILEKNTEDPLRYLQDEETEGSLIFAVFALTDLNCQEALPLFIQKQKDEKNPVNWEIYEEAIHRLTTNYIASKPIERMVWLNGNLTPTQRALGAESDNVFVKRAQQKVVVDDNVYETDEE